MTDSNWLWFAVLGLISIGSVWLGLREHSKDRQKRRQRREDGR